MATSDAFRVETVLAPVDGSEESATAVEYAVGVADRYDASVHVLYVLGRGVHHGMDAGTIDEHEVSKQTRTFLEDVRKHAHQRDIPVSMSVAHGFSKTRKTLHPGSVVLDTADEVGVEFIVIPREGGQDATAEILEKVAEYVLAYASQPVLSV
jgi:nucleotide-binding universal stress UspA family protein